MATEIMIGRKDKENIPSWVRNNRQLAETLKQKKEKKEHTPIINGKNPLQIGSEKLQLILDENKIYTIAELEAYLPLVKAPMYKKLIKNFIEESKKK